MHTPAGDSYAGKLCALCQQGHTSLHKLSPQAWLIACAMDWYAGGRGAKRSSSHISNDAEQEDDGMGLPSEGEEEGVPAAAAAQSSDAYKTGKPKRMKSAAPARAGRNEDGAHFGSYHC